MLPFESIIYEPLDKANTQECRQLYGVEFVPPSKQEIGRFTTTCDILISEQQRLLDETKHAFTINKPAIVYMPTAFLAKKLHPKWSEQEVTCEARSKTASTPRLASHKGGAAVDILLQRVDDDSFLDFGHDYPDGGVLVFPRTPYVTAEQWRNRQLLQVSAGLSGITLYVGEDWHISFGDNLAALDATGKIEHGYEAKYGPIKDFDRATGEITSIYSATELDIMFDY